VSKSYEDEDYQHSDEDKTISHFEQCPLIYSPVLIQGSKGILFVAMRCQAGSGPLLCAPKSCRNTVTNESQYS
jgi:hypothetical protein